MEDGQTPERIAESMLMAALRLWGEEDYLPILTLAGAAEEVFEARLRQLGQCPSYDQLDRLGALAGDDHGDDVPVAERLVSQVESRMKANLAHYGDDGAHHLALRLDAEEMLNLAIDRYHALTMIERGKKADAGSDASCP